MEEWKRGSVDDYRVAVQRFVGNPSCCYIGRLLTGDLSVLVLQVSKRYPATISNPMALAFVAIKCDVAAM